MVAENFLPTDVFIASACRTSLFLEHLCLRMPWRNFFKGIFPFDMPVKPNSFNHR